MNNIKLNLTNWGDLDLGGESAIPLNYNLNDVRDISTRGGEYSKTIKLYGTARNNAILGPIFNVDTQFLTFNPQVVEPCILSRDGEVVLEGTFQIRRILKRYTGENEIVIYDVYLKSNNSDFYTIINSRFLADLDMSAYNHYHTKDVIIDSMRSGNFLKGYQYFNSYVPVVEYPVGSLNLLHLYEPEDFKPAIYVKPILDRIFLESGFTYEFDELYEHNIDKLIITTNREEIIPGIIGDLFRAGITQFNSYLTSKWEYGVDSPFGRPYIPPNVPVDITLYQPNVVFDNDNYVEWNLFDVGARYNNVVGEYELDDNEQNIYFESTFIINTWVKPIFDCSIFGLPSNQVIGTAGIKQAANLADLIQDEDYGDYTADVIKQRITAYIIAYDVNDNILLPPIGMQDVGINEFNTNQTWDYLNQNNFTNELIANVSGEFLRIQHPTAKKVKVVVADNWTDGAYPFQGFIWQGVGYLGPTFSTYFDANQIPLPFTDAYNLPCHCEFGFDVFLTNPLGYFKNDAAYGLREGSFVNMNNVMPTDMKQSDFLLSLVKMYNLYITNDKENYRNLIIKTRDKFYEDGAELNWNSKVDINSIELDILSNSLTKITNFVYKEDSGDEILKRYKDFTKYEYGELEYVFFNQFSRDISEVRPNFSNAVLEWIFKKNIPLIPSRAKTEVKILSVGQFYDTGDITFTYRVTTPTLGLVISTENQYVYRHVGHFYPNSFEPKEDINFGVCEYYTHNYSTITNNNLFNRFYRNQFDIFEKGYIMTAKFKLNYLDILNLNMDERIFVNGSWWNINRIIDFDLNANNLTEVELITADTSLGNFIPNHNLFINKRLMDSEINTWGKLTDRTNKINTSSNITTNGNSNKVENTSNGIVIGDFNYVKNNNGLIIGSNNIVDGSGLIVLGGFNKTYEGRNKVYVNGLVEQVDLIDGGENEVRNPFGDTNIHLIDGSVDEVLDIDSHTNIHLIDGGTD